MPQHVALGSRHTIHTDRLAGLHPPDAQQPCSRERDGERNVSAWDLVEEPPPVLDFLLELMPTRKHDTARIGIDLACRVATIFAVAAPIAEHVRQRVTHLTRPSQEVRVIAVAEYATAPPLAVLVHDRRIEVLRRRDAEALDPFRERLAAVCLDDQMQVIALDADVRDPEVLAMLDGGVEAATNSVITSLPT